jgi:glycyl-tRNA synthetase beta chain
MSDFLLEIGLEEVPARMIAGAETELGRRVSDLLTRERLLAPEAKLTTYSTPRRLAVLAEGVLARQADTEEQLTGPSWKVAFKDSAPTAAAQAFAKKAGVAVADLERVETPKGEYVGATVKRTGRTANEILAAELPKEVLAIYWAKNMYWRAGKAERFVRPVRWIVALMDSEIVPLEIAGIAAGNASRGHRVLHGDAPVTIASAGAYKEALRAAYVIGDVAERRQIIRKALDAATRTVPGARWREDEELVETVTHLAEWPSVILGDFEPEYLELPEEVLVTVMRDHQKYFAVEDEKGKLAPHFLAVLNTQADQEGAAIIRHGNARVLRARFKDARFFWDFDQKTPLNEREGALHSITFYKELGSYWKKTQQTLRVAEDLAKLLEIKSVPLDRESLLTATRLAKCDLSTELVKEFTELQGIIGGVYARAQGLGETVARAIYDQYTPASTDDPIPVSIEGQVLGIADRLQTIGAMFSIGVEPTGSKDPYALRRAANGIVKILAESNLPVSITEMIGWVPEVVNAVENAGAGAKLRSFFQERVTFYLKDVRGFAYDVVNAVMGNIVYDRVGEGWDDVRDAIARAEALTAARGSEDFLAVSAAFKRIKNILRQAEEKGYARGDWVNIKAAEAKNLRSAIHLLADEVAKLREQRNYPEALAQIATLRPAVDAFFDKVMVLDPDEQIRGANLALIAGVLSNFSAIADFSEIVTG